MTQMQLTVCRLYAGDGLNGLVKTVLGVRRAS
jgi:hypothetical protein